MWSLKKFERLSKPLLTSLVELYYRAYQDDPTYAYKSRDRIKNYLHWLTHRTKGGILVAFEGQKPVGFLAYEEMLPCPEIHELAVLPEYKGRHVAEKLMQEVLKYLQGQGYSKVALWVGENNQRAQRFYQKLGFVPTQKLGIWIRMEKGLQEDRANSRSTKKAASTSERETVSSGV